MAEMAIGQLAKLTNCKVPTIRYYEKVGLLPEARRNEGNQRRYSEEHLKILRFIRHARALGFDQESVRQLLQLSQCHFGLCNREADEIAKQHLQHITQRIQQLKALESELRLMIDTCEQEEGAHRCRVLEVLSDHELCSSEHGIEGY